MGKREATPGSGRWPWLPTAWVGVTQASEGWGQEQVAFVARVLCLEEIPGKAGLELGSLLPRQVVSPDTIGDFGEQSWLSACPGGTWCVSGAPLTSRVSSCS